MKVHISWQIEIVKNFDEARIRTAAQSAMTHQNAAENSEITIVFADDEELHRLNKQFLGIDSPTDVLSFPSGEPDPETGAPYLGDILISLPCASKQAKERGHATDAELTLLTVHGVLHLMGHDHAEPEEKSAMWAAQRDIIDLIGAEVKMP